MMRVETTDPGTAALDRLDRSERSEVLARLLASHPELRAEAEALAREALDDVDEGLVADEVVDVYCSMEVRRIGDRMGRRLGRGYVDEYEAASELLEEALHPFLAQITRRGRAGFTEAARRYASAVLTGLDELRRHADHSTVFGWDCSEETAGSLAWSVERAAEDAGVQLPNAGGRLSSLVAGGAPPTDADERRPRTW